MRLAPQEIKVRARPAPQLSSVARPGRIKLDRAVPLAHPRHDPIKTTPAFVELKAELSDAVRVEVLAAQAAATA